MSVALILAILKLVSQIFSEYFSWAAQKKKENKAYEVDMNTFREFVNKSLITLTKEARQDSAQARDVEDQVDAEINKKD